MDTLGCGFLALEYPACTKLLGPVVPGATLPGRRARAGHGLRARPGAGGVQHRRDDPLAGLQRHLAGRGVGASVGQPRRASSPSPTTCRRRNAAQGSTPLTVRDVLTAMIKAHEIQGVLALENSFNRVGLDHVLLVRIASTAVATRMLGGTREQIDQRGLERVGRRRGAAHLPPRAEHRLAQELGGRRRDQPRACGTR